MDGKVDIKSSSLGLGEVRVFRLEQGEEGFETFLSSYGRHGITVLVCFYLCGR